jgi:hypothetical protein
MTIRERVVHVKSKKENKRLKKVIAQIGLLPEPQFAVEGEGIYKPVEEKNPKVKIVKRNPFSGGLPGLGKR